jgi:hypothetical protein
MMKKIIVAIIGVLFMMMSNLTGQVNVISVNEPSGKPAGNGVYYTLPRTVLQIDVIVKVEERLKGPLSEHAEKFLGITDAIKYDNTFYQITDLFLTTHVEPDPEAIYYVEMGQRDSKDPRSLLLELNESGYLLSVNTLDNQTLRATKSSRQIVMIDGLEYSTDGTNEFIHTGKVTTTYDTILRRVAVDTVLTEQMHFRFRTSNKSGQEIAVEILEKIDDIRDSRYRLLTGFQETPYEAATIKYMDTELQEMESEYLDLFRGKSFSYLQKYTFHYVPGKNPDKSATSLFRFSSSAGINQSRSSSGEIVEIQLEAIFSSHPFDGFQETKKPEILQNGIACRIPGSAVATIRIGKEELLTERITINQFGAIKRLPPQKFKAEFFAETGSIKTLVMD